MRRKLGIAGLFLGLAAWPAGAGASGDGGCSGGKWTLVAPTLDCGNRIVIGPGNDTRVNLMLLLRDRAGLSGFGGELTEDDNWYAGDYGRTFFDWDLLVDSLYPTERPNEDVYAEPAEFEGTRCQSVESGGEQFLAAVARNRRVAAGDRERLNEGRAAMLQLCRGIAGSSTDASATGFLDLALPRTFSSPEGREFGTYLAGAAAFYSGDWRLARQHFAALRAAKDEWVRETALYMNARSELGAAAAVAMDEWGYFDESAADKELAQRADRSLAAYLEEYPTGRYAPSAAGLQRRARWLGGALAAQGEAYARMVEAIDPATSATADLLEEIDNKFLFRDGAVDAIEGPWLLAMLDLLRMRHEPAEDAYWSYGTHDLPALSAAELAGQEAAFAAQPELFEFLQANHAFYVDRDYRAVLRLLPDDARRSEYSPLQFSRQVLRGMALAGLGDRNEAGFWQELLGGAKALYQRPTVELGLALKWERTGQVAKVFAPGSPIEDERIRTILLEHSAGPDVLRSVARETGLTQQEKDLAAYVLLYRELSRGQYAAAARDLALVRADAPTLGYDEVTNEALIPLGLFTRGTFSEDYACPALSQTAATLARNADDVKGRLCLGEFYRLNGFDGFYVDWDRQKGELGSFAKYPGEPIPRSQLYANVIAEPGVSRDDRAYALYRAIHCYAPAGYNDCGGDDVSEETRRGWFRRLKGEFGATRWGQEARYYW